MSTEDSSIRGSQQGSTTVLVVALLPVFLLLMGLSIDIGRVLAAKSELYKASDLAARELARRIDVTEAAASGNQVRHIANVSAEDLVEENLDGLAGAALTSVSAVDNGTYVLVESGAEVPLPFSGIAGRKTVKIKARSAARLKPYTAEVSRP
ncbi:MAG: pilus assembly protein TadG-related protein [Actinomycetota bacterium]